MQINGIFKVVNFCLVITVVNRNSFESGVHSEIRLVIYRILVKSKS